MICVFCKTEINVNKSQVSILRTMDLEPPASCWVLIHDENGKPDFEYGPIHHCKNGVQQVIDEE